PRVHRHLHSFPTRRSSDLYFSDVARINGMRAPDPIEVPADEPIRLRIVNIQVDFGLTVQMLRDTVPVSWTPVAKDGAELPAERKDRKSTRLNSSHVKISYA